MKDNSLLKLGGTCAILLGIVNGLTSVLYFLIPPAQRAEVPAAQILPSVAQDATFLMLLFWSQVAVGILGVAVVPALARLVQEANEGWVRWTSNLATAGFVVSAVGYLLTISRLPGIAAAYVAGDASTKAALAAVWKSSIDLQGMWGYGAVGAWVLVVSLFALRGTKIPRVLAYVGILDGIGYIAIVLATFLKIQELLLLLAAAGLILSTVWYVWMGLTARRQAT